MYFLFFLVLLTCIALLKPLEICFTFDSDLMEARVSASWLFLAKIIATPGKSNVSIYILDLKILSKPLKKKRASNINNNINMIKALSIRENRIEVSYGLNQPYLTGLFFGAISSLGSLVRITNLRQHPDFLSVGEYLRISSKIKIDLAKTLANFISLKLTKKKRRTTMDQTELKENVDSLFRSLENFTQNEGIIGKPVTQGDKTFLPVVSITVGYGGGNASMGKNPQASSSGKTETGTEALGLGAKLCTDAVILIDNQNVSLLSMNSNASNLMDKIPQMISGMGQNKQSGQAQGQNQPANQAQGSF